MRGARGDRLTLVTGGAGFIGSHIVHELVRRGERVRVIDNLATGNIQNLAEVESEVEFHQADLAVYTAVNRAMVDVTDVLHIGALGSVPRSMAEPMGTHQANVTGTLNVLHAARDGNVRRVVFSSSSSVYGDTEVLPKVETMNPNPRSPYAASKLAGEAYCQAYQASLGLETVILRYFNVFGPRQSPDSQYAAVIPRFIKAMSRGEPPIVYGDGLQSRDFTYIDNVVAGTVMARDVEGASGGIFNLGCSSSHTLLELVSSINRTLGTDLQPIHQAPRPGDVRHSYADIAAASAWGYRPTVEFEVGILRTVAHHIAKAATR